MDVIQHCLSLTPVPYLSAAFAGFRFLWKNIEQVKDSRAQLQVLALCISQLLCTLDTECRAHRQIAANVVKPVQDLSRFVGLQGTACAM